jgi:hypothetical protein
MDTTKKAHQLYLIRITSSKHTGRFVGFFVSGVPADPDAHMDPPLPLEGTQYSSWAGLSPNKYFEPYARTVVQVQLKKAGYSSELVPVPNWLQAAPTQPPAS